MAGYLQPVVGQPGFALLLFRTPEANRLVAQKLGADGNIREFTPIDPPAYTEISTPALQVEANGPALWAYVLPGEAPCIGARGQVAEWLGARLGQIEDPLLRLQAAEFCERDQPVRDAWRAAYERLSESAPRSAVAWRDVVVLPGRVRQAVAQAILEHGIEGHDRDLGRDVGVSVENGKLHLSFDAGLFEALGNSPGALAGIAKETKGVREAFDLADDLVATSRDNSRFIPPDSQEQLLIAVGRRAIVLANAASLDNPSLRNPAGYRLSYAPEMEEDQTSPPVLVASGTRILYHGDAGADGIAPHLPPPASRKSDPALILFTVMPGKMNVTRQAVAQALDLRRAGYRTIGVIPHLPHYGMAENADYANLLDTLQDSFDTIYMVSDHSAYTRGGLPFGPSYSLRATTNRLRELLRNIDSHLARTEADTRTVGRGSALVHLIGSAIGSHRTGPVRLVDLALQGISDFPLDWNGAARLHVASSGIDRLPREYLLDLIDREGLGSVGTHFGGDNLAGPDTAELKVEIDAAEWLPLGLEEFHMVCAKALQKHGWDLIDAGNDETNWRIHQAGLEVLVDCRAYGVSRKDFRLRDKAHRRYGEIVVLTNVPVTPGDYARMMLNGQVPVHYSKIGILRTLLMRRYSYLLSALRRGGHERELIEAAFAIFIDTLKTGQEPPGVQLATQEHRIVRTPRGFDLDLDSSRVTMLKDAARIDLVIDDAAARGSSHKAIMILHKEGWMVGSNPWSPKLESLR
ncbi:hypothetical protein [Sphingomonas sp. OTU376]|uniref:hypothetical protein n=1 Tax=Sphingomonas sp. OTU376 TaxID=3043863 RepID=UPI00313E9DAE